MWRKWASINFLLDSISTTEINFRFVTSSKKTARGGRAPAQLRLRMNINRMDFVLSLKITIKQRVKMRK